MYRASVENRGDSKYYANTKDYHFVMDTEGGGANPVDTLVASLCGCIGHQVREYLCEQRISSHGFAVTAEAGLTNDKTRLCDISLSIDMKDIQLDNVQRVGLLKYIERCKIHNTLRAGCSIKMALSEGAATGR